MKFLNNVWKVIVNIWNVLILIVFSIPVGLLILLILLLNSLGLLITGHIDGLIMIWYIVAGVIKSLIEHIKNGSESEEETEEEETTVFEEFET